MRLATSEIYETWSAEEVTHQTRAEAEQLVCEVMGWSRLSLLQHLTQEVPADSEALVEQAVERRLNGEPLAYILGHTHFYGRVFETRPGCLIPRPDTETLVEATLSFVRSAACRRASDHPLRLVEIGPGTGCIAVTLALECPQTSVTAVDIAKEAVELTRENALHLGASVEVIRADGLQWLRAQADVGQSFDVIVSNPPYIPKGELLQLDRDVRDFEPHIALDGGVDGLDFYRAFADLPTSVLGSQARCAGFFFEVGSGQAQHVAELFRAQPGWSGFTVRTRRDLRGIERVVEVIREGRTAHS
ncbi:peptide chain release factor N(5)-glutamine methyltransferase [Alicyclobacillus fastidiosus]|uniref:peptide chain release factor N(5)-glutamine methyltransferase n=1 Tax=Alicyclobacillus fastidiosus TaxID=392011 RepID=UPI0024E10E19|nr:peptide chain release factor N(5)-glutamine methyltransferase [Alicyclobacillus fastidiosus]